MPRLFGTDGVRGVANEGLTPDLALALGRAAGLVLAPGARTIPAFEDARVSNVRMSLVGKEKQMTGTKVDKGNEPTTLENTDSAIEKFSEEIDQRFAKLIEKQGEHAEKQAEQIAGIVTAAFDSAFQRLESLDAQGAGAQAAARFKITKEPPIYRFDGDVMKPSLVKDAWLYHRNGDYDARDRLRKFQDQQEDMVKFQQVNTTSAADVIPPGYRPDLFVTELMQGRPIVAQGSRGTITDATPFTVPQFVRSANNAGDPNSQPVDDHTPRTNPAPRVIELD
jgi:hypothetical protein